MYAIDLSNRDNTIDLLISLFAIIIMKKAKGIHYSKMFVDRRRKISVYSI